MTVQEFCAELLSRFDPGDEVLIGVHNRVLGELVFEPPSARGAFVAGPIYLIEAAPGHPAHAASRPVVVIEAV